MTTLLGDIKEDRISFTLPDDAIAPPQPAQPLTFVRLGEPEVHETAMCAKCIGECKVF